MNLCRLVRIGILLFSCEGASGFWRVSPPSEETSQDLGEPSCLVRVCTESGIMIPYFVRPRRAAPREDARRPRQPLSQPKRRGIAARGCVLVLRPDGRF